MMACIQFLLLFCSFMYIFNINPSCAQIPNSPIRSLVLPVTKDPATFQYLTTIYHGTSREPIRVVLDLGCPSLWLDCSSGRLSSSKRLIPSCSIQCAAAKPNNMSCAFSAAMPTRKRTACGLSTENSITRSATRGELVEDILTIQSVDGSKSGPVTTVDHFLFSCAPRFLLNRLARGAQGMLGLGKSRIALPSQLASKFGLQRKFATCLSSSDGLILFGHEPGYDSIFGTEISSSLMYTPLVTSPDDSGSSQDYSINVKSIKINGKRLSLRQKGIIGGGTKISTTVPYTTLESSIYNTFIEAYKEAATNNYFLNMTVVAPVAPFGLCFSSKEVPSSMLLGPMVPAIDLVLQSKMVKWRVHGRNAMVPVLDEVMCLGFLDGGFKSKTSSSIVIGGFQLEDNLLEFNLGTSMLGFSSSLLTRHTSCSDYNTRMMLSTLKDS